MKKNVVTALILAAVLAVGTILGSVLSPQAHATAAQAQTASASPATVITQGVGEISVKPDQTTLTIGVQEENKDAKAAQAAVTTAMNSLIAAMKKAGVKEADLKTTQYMIYPNYDWSNNKQTQTGYTVSHTLNVRIDGTEVGALIDAATSAGANQIQSVNFGLKDQTIPYNQALQAAVADAKAKAEVLAKAAGKTVDSVFVISENGAVNASPYASEALRAMNMAGVMDATQIISGDLTVSANVVITYTLK